jgi:hypothetical protein
MSKIWTRGVIAALGILIGLPAVGSAHAYTGVAPAAVKASLVSTRAHAKVQTVKHKKKHKRKHKAKKSHKSALKSKASAHTRHRAAAHA